MAVSKSKKTEILDALVADLKESSSVWFVKMSGLSVSEITNIRTGLLETNGKLIVAKKTLMVLAMKEAFGVEMSRDILPQSVAILISKWDAIESLSKVNSSVKELGEEKLEYVACYFEGELKEADEAKQIASMPSRDTLLGRMVGSMMSPLSSLARLLDASAKEVEEQGKENLSQIEKKEESND